MPARASGPRRTTLLARHAHRHRADLSPPVRISPPAPGVAVLACRCGRVLALADMHRPRRPGVAVPGRSGPSIEPIRCGFCAGAS